MKIMEQWNVTFHAATVVILASAFLLVSPAAEAQEYLYNRAELATGSGPAGVLSRTSTMTADWTLRLRISMTTTYRSY